jgi:beta-N-acetylhexosaminidase
MASRTALSGSVLCVGIAGPRLSAAERRTLKRIVPGAVILFKRNYESRGQLVALCAEIHRACNPPPLIAVDQEGGRVIRFGGPFLRLDAARTLARRHTPDEVRGLAEAMGRELRAAGIAIDFAPVLDVLTNPANEVIGDRGFGSSADRVTRYGLAFMRGLADGGVIPCAKHFPGHGNVREDSHLELPVSRARRHSLREVHLRPFVAAIAAGAPIIMIAHLMVPVIDRYRPASLSRRIIEGLLREQLGFDGVVASDDLQMEALREFGRLEERALAALEAGTDMLLVCKEIEAATTVFAAIERKRKSDAIAARISTAARRIAKLRRLVPLFSDREPHQ